jgi:hypothetical protein
MIVEGFDHLAYLLESVDEKQWRFIVGVADRGHDVVEPPLRHVLVEAKWSAVKHVHRISRPPEITVLDALERGIELLEVQGLLLESLVRLGDHYPDDPLLREANSEERELVQICDLVPLSVLEFFLNVGNS